MSRETRYHVLWSHRQIDYLTSIFIFKKIFCSEGSDRIYFWIEDGMKDWQIGLPNVFKDFSMLKKYRLTAGCPRGAMVKAMDYEIVVSEFELQSRYYVHFRAYTPGKVMNPLIHPAVG